MRYASNIVDKRGDPFVIEKSVYNLEPNFWDSIGGQGNIYYDDMNSKPYQFHSWVYRCANVIATNISRLKHRLLNRSTDDVIDEHEVLSLFKKPNPEMTEITFWQFIILYLLLPSGKAIKSDKVKGGQVFLVPSTGGAKVDLSRGVVPEELNIFTDEHMRPWKEKLPNGMYTVKGWIFDPPQGKKIEFEKTEIIRIFQPNPYNVLGGMAQQIAAMVPVNQDGMADIFNSRTFENDGRVSGLLTTDKDTFTSDDARQWHKLWSKLYGGPNNAGKTAVLGGGLKYQPFGQTLADMQYTAQKELNKKQIISTYGLNRIALGDYEDINFATIKEGRKLLWYDTYLPLDALIWDAINAQFVNYVQGGVLQGYSDTSDLDVLREDKSRKIESIAKLTSQSGYPPELAAKTVGIPISDEDLAKWPHLSEQVSRGGSVSIAGNDDNKKALPPIIKGTKVKIIDRPADEDIRLSVYIKQVLDPAEKSFKRMLIRFFNSQRNRTMDKVDEWLKTVKTAKSLKAVVVKPEIFLLDAELENKKFIDLYTPEAKNQMELEKEQLEKELGKLIEWDVTDTSLKRFVKIREPQLKKINNLTFKTQVKEVSKVIEKSFEENWTPQQTAKEIKNAIGDVYEGRKGNATTIARTEMGTVSSLSRADAFRKEGIEKWQWLTAGDDLVRTGEHSHRAFNGQIQNVGEPFERFGAKTLLNYPRDPDAEAADVINCRCVVVAVE